MNSTELAAEAAERIGTHTDIESSTAIIKTSIEKATEQQSGDTKRLDWALRYLKEVFPDQITKASSFTINLKSNVIDREYIDAAMSQTKE